MKRIEFIAPVEAIRGNLSGKQKLVYAENDNPAYEAPIGRQYARNYRPSFIGAKRASDGLKYFSVKTKSATGLTLSSKKAMAVLGGAGAFIAGILRDPSRKTALQIQLEYNIQHGLVAAGTSLRKWMCVKVQECLRFKKANVDFKAGAGTTEVKVMNPWFGFSSAGVTVVGVGDTILVKFWDTLATDPIFFSIEGAKGVAHVGDEWALVIENEYNVLGLTYADGSAYVQMNGMYVIDAEGVYQQGSTVITAGKKYLLTEAAPE